MLFLCSGLHVNTKAKSLFWSTKMLLSRILKYLPQTRMADSYTSDGGQKKGKIDLYNASIDSLAWIVVAPGQALKTNPYAKHYACNLYRRLSFIEFVPKALSVKSKKNLLGSMTFLLKS